MSDRVYVAIDLKSFYASVECVQRGLDPLDSNLVVADMSRTEKTICLAVSPALKSFGVPGRPRLFEVVQICNSVNIRRKAAIHGRNFKSKSYSASLLNSDPYTELSYIVAKPRMSLYMEISSSIYSIYLKYVSKEDMHVYSVDEVFIDATSYLKMYNKTAREFTMMLIKDVLKTTGITATAGIGTNLYLCKIAMDIVAKHIPADSDGVRIAELDEMSYRNLLWNHRPLIDFWRIGKGTSRSLESRGIYTMGDIARLSVTDEELLYKLFGVNAELIIDHAWGWEPCELKYIKSYTPQSNSIGCGQVLSEAYTNEKALIVLKEMANSVSLTLVAKNIVTKQIVLSICYDSSASKNYSGAITKDWYGRSVPKPAHGSINLDFYTSSSVLITKAASDLFCRITDKDIPIRRIYITASDVVPADSANAKDISLQYDLFSDFDAQQKEREKQKTRLEKEQKQIKAVIDIKKKFGNNAIVKAIDLLEGATALERNSQIGGHKA